MTKRMVTGWCVLGLAVGAAARGFSADAATPDAAATAAAPAPAAAPRVVRRRAAPVKVSTTQLFTTLGTLESKIDAIQKSLLTMPRQAASPTVQMPGPGEGVDAKNMMQAFYNYGSYMKQADNKRLTASLIRDFTLLGGAIFAIQGWESSRDRWQVTPTNQVRFTIGPLGQIWQTGSYRHVPLTFKNSIPYYTSFTVGISTAVVGMIVSEFIQWSAIGSEKQAAASLMHPLEAQPQTAP